MKPTSPLPWLPRTLLGVCGVVDLGFAGFFAVSAFTGGLGKQSWAIWLFAFVLLLFSLFGVYALKAAVQASGFPFSKPVFIVASVIHVVLGLLVQIGPGFIIRISTLIGIGTIYFVVSLKTTKALPVAT
jgi:hypothetical protein